MTFKPITTTIHISFRMNSKWMFPDWFHRPFLIDTYHPENVQELHLNALQRYALAALRDGLDLTTIKDLASLASWGQHLGNVERDLLRWFHHCLGPNFHPTVYGLMCLTQTLRLSIRESYRFCWQVMFCMCCGRNNPHSCGIV